MLMSPLRTKKEKGLQFLFMSPWYLTYSLASIAAYLPHIALEYLISWVFVFCWLAFLSVQITMERKLYLDTQKEQTEQEQ